MINFAAIAKAVADAFTAGGCTSVEFWRPTQTVAGAGGASTPGTVTQGAPVWTPVRAFILPASKGADAFDNGLEDDALDGKETRYLKLAAYDLSITPRANDQFRFSGKVWLAKGCTPVDVTGGCPLVHGVGVVAL